MEIAFLPRIRSDLPAWPGRRGGERTVAFHTNTEAKSWDLLFKMAEAELGITLGA
ncbi:hypothetical protein [Nonomuraea sp. NPDC003804]|uniref:hypothetical protein n=1 Tax=Nonomuraea sp. NPDC003804 TaxID=3154547 RepID=UPI0033A0E719